MPTCPSCGTTFPLWGDHVCVRINNHDTEIVRATGSIIDGSTSHEDLAEVFTANNSNNGETIMPTNTTTTNNTITGENIMPTINNGVNTMNTTIDLATLVAMVNNYKETHQNEVSQAVTDNSVYNGTTQSITQNVTVDGGPWAKKSKYYGQELCGFMYNPFMVSRFLPMQFKNLMNDYDKNVDKGIKQTVSPIESIKFMIEECKRLDLMERKDKIAFEERKQFWSVSDAREIFKDYISKIQANIEKRKSEIVSLEHRKGNHVTYIKIFGKKYNVKFEVKVPEGKPTSCAYTEAIIDWKYEKVLKTIIVELGKCKSYGDLYKLMSFREKELIHLKSAYKRKYLGNGRWETIQSNSINTLSKVFIDGYKRKGAYYTLKNEIMFHDATYCGVTGRDAVALLRDKLNNKYEGYKFYAELKAMLADDHLPF